MGMIIDIALGVIALIAFIVGLKKGFVKQFTGMLNGLLAFAGSVVIVYFVMPFIQNLDLFKSFSEMASGWFTNEAFAVEITDAEQLAQTLSGAGAWSILASLSEKLFEMMTNLEVTTVGALFGFFAATAIVGFVFWLIVFLIVKGILKLIRSLLVKFASLPVIRTIDRIFGAIWSIAITYLIIVSILLTGVEIGIMYLLPDKLEGFMGIIQQSSVLTLLNDTNIIGSFLAGLLNMELPKVAVPAE